MNTLFRPAFLALAALIALPSFAQYGPGGPHESDRDYCASGRSGLDYRSCMYRLHEAREQAQWQMQMQAQAQQQAPVQYGEGYYQPEPVMPGPGWAPAPPVVAAPGWVQQPAPMVQPAWIQAEPVMAAPAQPRLSAMQQRALDNCVLLPPAQQPRCRATVWSTVR